MLAILISLALNSSIAFAKGGTVVGDGGHSVVCKLSETDHTVDLYDVYQAQTRMKFGMFEMPLFLETGKSTELFLRDLALIDFGSAQEPMRRSILRAQAMAGLVTVVETLPYTHDVANFDSLPAGCEVRQLGITNESANRIGVSVVRSEWDRLDEAHRAVFLLHEALHFELRDPEAVRQVVGYTIGAPMFQSLNRAVVERIFATGHAAMWSEFTH